jgi:hypothetical protein
LPEAHLIHIAKGLKGYHIPNFAETFRTPWSLAAAVLVLLFAGAGLLLLRESGGYARRAEIHPEALHCTHLLGFRLRIPYAGIASVQAGKTRHSNDGRARRYAGYIRQRAEEARSDRDA